MATLGIGEIVQVRFYCNYAPQGAINVRHYKVTEVNGGSATDNAFAAVLSAVFPALYKAAIADTAEYGGLQVQIVSPERKVEVTDTTGAGNGALTGDLLPPQVSGLITFRGTRSGRQYRSRVYIPFPTEGESGVGGTPSVFYTVQLANLANAFLTTRTAGAGANTALLTPVVTPRTYLTTETLTSSIVRTKWATQRRRSFLNRNDNPGPPL